MLVLRQSGAGRDVIGRNYKLQMPARYGDRLANVILHRSDNFLHDDGRRLPRTDVAAGDRGQAKTDNEHQWARHPQLSSSNASADGTRVDAIGNPSPVPSNEQQAIDGGTA